MKKRNIVKMFSLLTALCMVSGCKVSTTTETTTTSTSAQTTTTVTTTAETTTSAEETDSEISGLAEAEIDYVDEYGYTYYKNPTIWTTEKIFEELTINGQKFEAPLTLEKLGEGYSHSTDGGFYDESTRTVCLRLMHNDKSLAWVYLDDCDSMDDIEGKKYNRLQFDVLVTDEVFIENTKLCGVNINSSEEELFEKMGIPAVSNGKYMHYISTEEKPKDFSHIENEIIDFYISENSGKLSIWGISM